MASPKWTEVLLNIAAQKCCSGAVHLHSTNNESITSNESHHNNSLHSPISFTGVPLVGNLRTRLLALHVLEAILPACEANVEDDQITQVLFKLL